MAGRAAVLTLHSWLTIQWPPNLSRLAAWHLS